MKLFKMLQAMESGKLFRSGSVEKGITVKATSVTKCKCQAKKKKKMGATKKEAQKNEKQCKTSMIPVLKCEKIDTKSVLRKQPSWRSFTASCCCDCNKREKEAEDFKLKLKTLEDKEKSIAEYYRKIEDTLRQMMIQEEKKFEVEPQSNATSPGTCARKMTSDPAVFSSCKTQNNALLDFENSVEQISRIWLKTSADLYKTLKNLKKNTTLDPMEIEVENVRIQLAIKEAKSLTLIKTKSVIAEANKLYNHGEMIRNHLEKLLSSEMLKFEEGKRGPSEGEYQEKTEKLCGVVNLNNLEKKATDGTGDTSKESETKYAKETDLKEEKTVESEEENKSIAWPKGKAEDDSSHKQLAIPQCSCSPSEIMAEEVENLAAELSRKNETITILNSKIFELQKACNEHLLKYNQLQLKLSEFHQRNQWSEVLWKQIGKLKERIKGLQLSNKQLESSKKELENKILKLDKELERLIKLNHLLNQRKYLLSARECSSKDCKIKDRTLGDTEEKYIRNTEYDDEEERILSDKQNAINQLKTVLCAMKDQENFAQKQIAMFQSKIEALEKKN